jgi:hypothetical protein
MAPAAARDGPRGADAAIALGALALVAVVLGALRDAREPARAVRFVDVTEAFGIARRTPTYDAALGDYDGDGRTDVYVGNHGAGAVLLHREDGVFVDRIAGSGIDPGGDQHGSAWGDYDSDGDLDLYVALGAERGRGAKQNRLYRNDGGGRFVEVGAGAGVGDPRGRGRGVAWLDADRDGRLDLVVANYASPSRLFRNRGDGTFADVSEGSGLAAVPASRIAWADVDADGFPDLLLAGTPGGMRLLRNDAGARFVDVTNAAGLAHAGGVQGMAFGDVDGDGDLDLATSRGVEFPDVVRAADGDRITFAFIVGEAGKPLGFDFEAAGDRVELALFENGSRTASSRVRCGRETPAGEWPLRCPGAAAAAGASDLTEGFVVWRDADGVWHLRWRGAGDHHLSGIVEGGRRPVAVGTRRSAPRSAALWLGAGGGRFERRRPHPALAPVANGQAVAWADLDDDGDLDLYVVDSGADGAPATNGLFMNNGKGGLVPAGARAGASPVLDAGRAIGAHFFDLEADGRLDLFLTNGWGVPPFDRGPYRLLGNVSEVGSWIVLELRGRRSNRQGLGAWIRVGACGRTHVRYHTGGGHHYSQSALPVHVGLGSCEEPVDVVVAWPSGTEQRLSRIPSRRIVVVDESDTPS